MDVICFSSSFGKSGAEHPRQGQGHLQIPDQVDNCIIHRAGFFHAGVDVVVGLEGGDPLAVEQDQSSVAVAAFGIDAQPGRDAEAASGASRRTRFAGRLTGSHRSRCGWSR